MNTINHSFFRWIALCASIFTFGLVVVGGVVRVTGFSAYFASLSPDFRQLVVDRIISES